MTILDAYYSTLRSIVSQTNFKIDPKLQKFARKIARTLAPHRQQLLGEITAWAVDEDRRFHEAVPECLAKWESGQTERELADREEWVKRFDEPQNIRQAQWELQEARRRACTPYSGPVLLPLPARELSFTEKCVILTAIHDYAFEKRRTPFGIAHPRFQKIVKSAESIEAADIPELGLLLADVADLLRDVQPVVVTSDATPAANTDMANVSAVNSSLTISLADDKYDAEWCVENPTKVHEAPAFIRRDGYRYTPTFDCVEWFGTPYEFAKGQQRLAVGHLMAAFEKGQLGISDPAMAERIDSDAIEGFSAHSEAKRKPYGFRLDGVFRNHPAWKTMIVQVAKGERLYTLKRPISS